MKKTIVLLMLMISLIHAEHNRTEELNKLSADVYMKKYAVLNKVQKKHIEAKLEKLDRIYQMALDYNVTQMEQYQKRMYKAEHAIAMGVYLGNVRDTIDVRDEEIARYYQTHLRDYKSVHAYTIVTKRKKELSPILEALRKSKKTLETFKRLAKKHSKHPRASKGGDMGFVGYNTIVQPFGKEAFSLKVGTYNKIPFKTTLGWHIVYVDKMRITPLEKMSMQIANIIRMKKYKEWFNKI